MAPFNEFARIILFGNRLSDKLVQLDIPENSIKLETDHRQPSDPEIDQILWTSPAEALSDSQIPQFPGRPKNLLKTGKAEFPSIYRLHEAQVRGQVLHFFANHELLAMELMALVLLRFPQAPFKFRHGIAQVIQEEQGHLQLYIQRMNELGVEFGELPVNDYFWNSMKNVKSPLDFVVQMSLTFEQANLDFSLFFMKATEKVGDLKTSAILKKVFLEEIGHVKHGLSWFNRWRENAAEETDWDAYVKLLPRPLTPQRAKGLEFSESARREAGLSETFIRELKVFTGSKGRPPCLWFYNPHCDSEIARGTPGFHPTAGAKRLSEDLEHIPMFLCLNQDAVLLRKKPKIDWIESLQEAGVKIPQFIELKDSEITRAVRQTKIGGVHPWGWSPDSFHLFRPLAPRLVNTTGGNSTFCKTIFQAQTYEELGFGKLFSKAWSVQFLKEWMEKHPESSDIFGSASLVGQICNQWQDAEVQILKILDQGHSVMVKAPFGTAGRQVRKIQNKLEWIEKPNSPLVGWIKNTILQQGSVIVEHYLNKIYDVSIQMEIHDHGTKLFECKQFITGAQNEYRGTYLGKAFLSRQGDETRFFHHAFLKWKSLLKDLGEQLRQAGYRGPAGVDALIWREIDGALRLKPLVELNPRWTMGRVALELEHYLLPGVQAVWLFLPIRTIKWMEFQDTLTFASEMRSRYPLQLAEAGGSPRIKSGILFTNNPDTACEVLTLLATLPNPDIERCLKQQQKP